MYADHLLLPWLNRMCSEYPAVTIFDAHTHIGENDPSGITSRASELVESLRLCGDARAAVFPLAEPDGYEQANLRCAEEAAASDGRLVSFVRVTPQDRPDALLAAGLEAGARGVKLHPSGDEFRLDDPRLDGVFGLADDRRLPVLVHAGPEGAAVGETALALSERCPNLRLILAHCALTDIGWIGRSAASRPNLFFDTSWWGSAHLLALFRLVPPGQILSASDLPYSTPVSATLTNLRCAHQAGLDARQIASLVGGQFRRILDGDDVLNLGPPPPHERSEVHPILELLSTTLLAALEPMQRGLEPEVPLDVARHACTVSPDAQHAPVVASVARLIQLYDEHHGTLPPRNQFAPGWDLIATASIVARTPAAPLPPL